jgi:hypothetical protein
MWLFPYRRFSIETSFTPAEVVERLRGAVEPERWLRWSRPQAPFEGIVGTNWFEVTRIIHYRNSFLPTISGSIDPTPRGSRLSGDMRINPWVLAFMIFWIVVVGIGGVGLLHQSGFDVALLAPLGMLAFGVALPLMGFIAEARRATQILTDLVKGMVALRPRPTWSPRHATSRPRTSTRLRSS